MIKEKSNTIKNPEDVNWEYFWQKKLKEKRKEKKDWDKAAKGFSRLSKQDEYGKNLISKMKLDKKYSVLDLGCGEGSITIPIAKKVAKLTAIDSSKNMLEILKNKCKDEKLNNIDIIKRNLEEVNKSQVGNYDIVLSSRSINGIFPIKKTLDNINKIANKYVYITLFGPNNWKFEREFYKIINKEYHEFAPYNYLFNILIEMGIYPNVENLEIKTSRSYESVYDAMHNGRWKLESFTEDEKIKLKNYLKKNLIENNKGRLENPEDKGDWVLIWWEK